MRYCAKESTRVVYFTVFSMFFVASLIFMKALIDALQKQDTVKASFFGAFFVFMGAVCAGSGILTIWIYRKFRILPDGILVAYPFARQRMILWSEVSEVAVCHIHRSRNRNGVHAIRVAVGEVFASGEDPYGLWQRCFEFSMRYHDNIIIFERTDELEEEFREVCPIPVKNVVT